MKSKISNSLSERAAIYKALSVMLSSSTKKELKESIENIKSPVINIGDNKMIERYENLERLLNSLPEEGEYLNILNLGEKRGLLYETTNLYRDLPVFFSTKQNILADIAGFYRAFGLNAVGERVDHISVELEFMSFLLIKEALAPDKEKAEICMDALKKFFNEHIVTWIFTACNEMKKLSPFYASVAEFLEAFMKYEKKVIENGMG